MKKWIALILIMGWTTALEATVKLPESGRLVGPLNALTSEIGEDFVNFPALLEPIPAGGGVPATGWIEFTFGEAQGDLVEFTMNYDAVSSDGAFVFGAGAFFAIFQPEAFPLPVPNRGTLNLKTGDIVDFQMHADVRSSVTFSLGRLNRMIPRLVLSFPRNDFAVPVGPFPPGFTYTVPRFNYDGQGRIVGFDFLGRTAFPLGAWAASNETLGYFPDFSFGPDGQVYLPNPDLCLVPDVPPELCPSNTGNPDGIELTPDSIFHSHLFLTTNELREASPDRALAPCAPEGRTGSIVNSIRNRLVYMGGARGDTVSRQVDIYNPATRTWGTGQDMPIGVYDAQAAVFKENLYVIGGRTEVGGSAIDAVQIYNAERDRWSVGAAAPAPLARGGAEQFGDFIYAFLGMTNDAEGELAFNDTLMLYSLSTDQWFAVTVPGLQLEGFATAIAGENIYIINGRLPTDDGDIVSPFVFIFSALFNDVFFTSPTRVGIYEGAAGIVGNRLVLAGGRQEFDGPASNLTQVYEVERSFPVLDVFARSFWSPARAMPYSTAAVGGAAVNGELFLVGGNPAGAGDLLASNVVMQYDAAQGWGACSSQPVYSSSGLLNTASLGFGAPFLSPGGLASIEGLNFGPSIDANDQATVPTTLGDIGVTIDGQPAPVLAVSPGRIDFQVPYGTASGVTAVVQVTKEGAAQQANPIATPIVEANPGIFVHSCGVTRDPFMLFTASAFACNADGTLNTFQNAVRPGEEVAIQMTGLGAIEAQLADGERAPEGVSSVLIPDVFVTSESGDPVPATVSSAILAPGEVGIYDVTIIVPPNAKVGNRNIIQATVAGASSNLAAISVGEPLDTTPPACMRDTNIEFRNCLPDISPVAEFADL